ncbi:hypothetical protein [Streptomyces sp. NPDC020298]|uniref:hypothetical protein n=1 Tax=unclassified Streptomyces TaxID=2593676 RepID=UPI0033D9C198
MSERIPAADGVADSGAREKRTERRLVFRPVANGLDYLYDVINRLVPPPKGEVNDRDLKYALLHLQAGAEVLLKARLELEHWSLVVDQLYGKDKITAARFRLGRFHTIGVSETLERLDQIAEVRLEKAHKEALSQLGETRNALQHYGLDQSAAAVQSQAVAVLDFLIPFVHEQILPHLHGAEREEAEDTLVRIRERLRGIEELVETRMARLERELAPYLDTIVNCPDCFQRALVVGTGDTLRCRFCFASWDAPQGAAEAFILTFGNGGWADDSPSEGSRCPECSDEGVVVCLGVSIRGLSLLCFDCGADLDGYGVCDGCNALSPHGSSSLVPGYCDECTAARLKRF